MPIFKILMQNQQGYFSVWAEDLIYPQNSLFNHIKKT
jgi:hypothetical protein